MYNSPIEIIYGQMQTQIEGDILKAVQQVGVHVDKEELIRALQYDREQYDKGYADGYQNAKDELVRCRDCKYRIEGTRMCAHPRAIGWDALEPEDDDFCSCGERKDNG